MPRVQPILHSRAHDYGHLIRRWRSVCRRRGLKLTPYTTANEFELVFAETRRPIPGKPWIYLSAGIHGDEAGATEGLLDWLSTTRLSFEAFNLLLFPCLNPWGLVNNSRTDAEGRDLNRTYHDDSVAVTAAHRAIVAARPRFAVAITLHEDYDANGIYIYEVQNRPPYWAETLLRAASRHVPVDSRRRFEGHSSRAGVVRRRVDPDMMPLHPEAFLLHFHHADRTFTVETPSEAHLDARAAAQSAVIDAAVRLAIDPNAATRLTRRDP